MPGRRRRRLDFATFHCPARKRTPRPVMAAYLIRRLWQMIPTLIGVVLLVFFLFK